MNKLESSHNLRMRRRRSKEEEEEAETNQQFPGEVRRRGGRGLADGGDLREGDAAAATKGEAARVYVLRSLF